MLMSCWSHRARYTCAAVAGALLIGCGSDGGPNGPNGPNGPDGPGETITIKTLPETPIPTTIPTANATLLAFQDGDGPWQALTGVDGVYLAKATGERYAVALGCRPVDGTTSGVAVFYRTVEDGADVSLAGCTAPPASRTTVTLTGVMAGVPPGMIAGVVVSTGRGSLTMSVSADGSFRRTMPIGQAASVMAITYSLDVNGRAVMDRYYVGPVMDFKADEVLNFDIAANGRPAQRVPLVVQGGGSNEEIAVSFSAVTRFGTFFLANARDDVGGTTFTGFDTVDASQLAAGDMVSVSAGTQAPAPPPAPVSTRSVSAYTLGASPVTLDLPAPLTIDTPQLPPTANPLMAVSFPKELTRNVEDSTTLTASATTAGTSNRYQRLTITARHAASSGATTYTAPDLSGLPGWEPSLVFVLGPTSFWTAGRRDAKVASRLQRSAGDRFTFSGTLGPFVTR